MKKILTLVYYHSMARFFCAIEDAWKQLEPDAQFLHLAVFPGAWAYFKIHGRQVVPLSWRAHASLAPGAALSDDELESLIRFHASDPNIAPAQQKKLQRQGHKMLGLCELLVTQFDPDVAIVSGDTRLPAESLMHALKGTRAVTWYFEQGPYRTTVLDRQGVNANCSFRRELARLEASGTPFKPPVTDAMRWSNKAYTLLDRFALAQGAITGLVPPDLIPYRLRQCSRTRYASLSSKEFVEADARKVVLVAMQVPEDANNIYHNPLRLDDVGLLQFVLASADPSWTIVVREHPLYRRKYSHAFYDLIAASGNVILSAASLSQDLERSRTTVTVNSMTGLDAFAKEHRVIVLGESFYDHIPGILTARSKAELRELLIGEYVTPGAKRAQLIGPLIDGYFFKGHFTDIDLTFTRSIAQRVLASLPAAT
ncbi:capsular polysaccharide export protein [Paraburkholderia sp. RAU2J]|uniref:capsular polysaccharide export protein, LipB/KpsS family n=1 Tax=Paraburkholderia sp. RAU2J TaxID=1938810 RepID=UPI000EAD2FEB|nr:capsular biosynthesis protein [Paraburkholderia sp. RAU2J]RKT10540.1 capsular polysaccharide export protein [Paraburkholderia sp. RAU2J]